LRVLKLLDELHFKHLHLHHFLLLVSDDAFLLGHALVIVKLSFHLLSSHKLLLLKKGYALLLFDHLVFRRSILRGLVEEDLLSLLVLNLHEPLLFHFLLLAQVDGFLNLLPFIVSDLSHLINLRLVILLDHLIDAELLHLLLNFHFIFLLESHDLVRPLLSLFYFLPGAHLLLLKESDSVC